MSAYVVPQIRIVCPRCRAVHLDWFRKGCCVCGQPLPKPKHLKGKR